MAKAKICVVGAGSVTFLPNLVRDLAVTRSLHGITLVLMDVDPERLQMAKSLASRYFSEAKVDIQVQATSDRVECIKGADVVLNMASAISNQESGTMMETAERFGYYRGIDSQEWNMVNNYLTFTGYKNFKIALGVAKDIEEHSPGAWMIQISNPVLEMTTLIMRETKVKVLGWCHGAHNGVEQLSRMALGIDPKEVQFQAAGFNHVVFLTGFRYRGEDAYPLIDRWLKDKAQDFWRSYVLRPWEETLSKAAADMYRLYGLYPLGDTARSGTWKYHYDLETKRRWYGPIGGVDSEIGWGIRLLLYQEGFNRFRRLALDHGVDLTKELPLTRSGETIVDTMDSLINGTERRLMLNVRNDGLITGLPNDVAVEVPVYVSGKGVRPESVGPFSKRFYSSVLYPRLQRMEWALDAFLSSTREVIVEALLRDPRTKSEAQARQAVDAVLNLPFNRELNAHYRGS
jgi:alpha-galactosidase